MGKKKGQRKAEEKKAAPTKGMTVRVKPELAAEVEELAKTLGMQDNVSAIQRALLLAAVKGKVILVPNGKELRVEALPPPSTPPPPLPPPKPPAPPKPSPRPVPAMPQGHDYLRLNSVALWLRNREGAHESYQKFLSTFEAERQGSESLHQWCHRTRSEEVP